jgi:hypothetical protein
MWPYEEYTLLENLLVIVIPYLFVMIVYLLLRPLLFRKLSEKQAEKEACGDEKDQEYW